MNSRRRWPRRPNWTLGGGTAGPGFARSCAGSTSRRGCGRRWASGRVPVPAGRPGFARSCAGSTTRRGCGRRWASGPCRCRLAGRVSPGRARGARVGEVAAGDGRPDRAGAGWRAGFRQVVRGEHESARLRPEIGRPDGAGAGWRAGFRQVVRGEHESARLRPELALRRVPGPARRPGFARSCAGSTSRRELGAWGRTGRWAGALPAARARSCARGGRKVRLGRAAAGGAPGRIRRRASGSRSRRRRAL